jgi:hypothetical protein
LAIDGCRRCLKLVANSPFSALYGIVKIVYVAVRIQGSRHKKEYLPDTSLGFCFLSVWGIG